MPLKRNDQTARTSNRSADPPPSRRGSPTLPQSVVSFVVEIVKVVIISLAIIIPVRFFLIQPFYVRGASMEPNFYDNEYLVVDEISYRFHAPRRGDVVVIRNPRHDLDFLIKRVIGLPGERVEILNEHVTIYNTTMPNGLRLSESYLPETARTIGTYTVTLASNEYFVLGDNRESSLDSRYFGPVDRREIVGRAWVRAWPLSRWTMFSTPSYSVVPTTL